jgi:hypothetical protein
MNQRFAASIAQTYVGWVDHAKWVEEIFIGTGCQRRTVGWRSRPDDQRANAPSSFGQQMSPVEEQDFSILPASGVSTPVSLTQRNLPQDLPVEAVPTPTAVTSGLMVLAAMAAVRIVRRLKRA